MSTKERTPAFLFYPKQFTGDDVVQAMDLDAVGAHILLMSSAAASPERCRIYADERAIRNRLRNPSDADWQRIKNQLLAGAWKLSTDGQWWEQDGLRRTFEKQQKLSESQREKANKRWKEDYAEPMPEACPTDAEPHAEGDAQKCLAVAVAFPVTDTVQNQNQNHTADAVVESVTEFASGRKSKAKPKQERVNITLPAWITSNAALIEAWNGYMEMRKATKQPATARAIELAIEKLDELRRKGDDPIEVLNQSTLNNYRGVFPLRRDGKPNGKLNHIDITRIDHSAGHEKRANGSLVF